VSAADDLPTGGRLVGDVHRLPVRVYYEDTDAGGIVYHANFLRYLERGRSELLRSLGIDHASAWTSGPAGERVGFAVRRIELDFEAPAMLDDALIVESTVVAVGAAYVDAGQCVCRAGRVIARARLRVALVDAGGRPRRLPEDWRRRLAAIRINETAEAVKEG